MKRLNLAIPEKLYEELTHLADEEGISDTAFITRAIKLWIFFSKLWKNGGEVYIAEHDSEDLTRLQII